MKKIPLILTVCGMFMFCFGGVILFASDNPSGALFIVVGVVFLLSAELIMGD